MLFKSTIREIKSSFGRFVAILAIVALGIGFFGGLRLTKPSMIRTLNTYLEECGFYDFRLISTLAFEDEDISNLKEEAGLSDAYNIEGAYSLDALCQVDEGAENVFTIMNYSEQMNAPDLIEGRLPQSEDECVIDSNFLSGVEFEVGSSEVNITTNNTDEVLDNLKRHQFKVVGIARNPMYISFERGTTSIGTGKVSGFIIIPKENFNMDYYTEVYVEMNAGREEKENNGHRYTAFSQDYKDYIDNCEEDVEEALRNNADDRYKRILAKANEEVDDAKRELDEQKAENEKKLSDAEKELLDGEKELADSKAKLEDGKNEIKKAKSNISAKEKELSAAQTELSNKRSELEKMKPFMGEIEYAYALSQLDDGQAQIDLGKREIAKARKVIEDKEAEILDGEKKIADGEEELSKHRQEYEDALLEFTEKMVEAVNEIEDAKTKIADINKPDIFVLDRNMNVGYATFEQNANIVEAVATFFPIIFLLVAVLVCMTTMNRMVEEQRTQIGVLKALGYSPAAIGSKFVIYAGSAALTGALIGYFILAKIIAQCIWQGYNILYNLGDVLEYQPVWYLAVISIFIALSTSIGTAILTVRYELTEVAANLIRPKAPKVGRRIFLERITPLWSRMKFLSKVSWRNIIRYKKRFVMMIVGIGGCTALVLTGYGIGDSIKGIAELQFENIQVYDMAVSMDDGVTASDVENIKNNKDYTASAFMKEMAVDATFGDKMKSVNAVTPENSGDLMKFLVLRTPDDHKPIAYPTGKEGVITQGAAEAIGVSAGDTVRITDSDMNYLDVKIKAVCENHFMNFIYLPENKYINRKLGKEVPYNSVWINIKEGLDSNEEGAKIASQDHMLNVTVIESLEERVGGMLDGMNFIVLVVIVAAGGLAFIVLYNLTNINITERVREIATIKVLGFYPMETAAYVFRENLVLTGIGAVVGLPFGKLLHAFIMYNIKIDMVYFNTYIAPVSYVYAIIMTFVFAMVVNFFMFFKLKKIDMAESLKSIE
ncbi:MAG: ABC transporter permease [Lachnospiraceae bacterium]|nr:ABC transporter permease [Lachnospiraceae bacterium]